MAGDKHEVTIGDLQDCLHALEEWLQVIRGALDSLEPRDVVKIGEPDPGISRIIRGVAKC